MPSKYPICKPTEVIAVLEYYGFRFISQRGSHRKYSDGIHVVIIPMHDVVKKGTLRSILQQAELSIDDFMDKYK